MIKLLSLVFLLIIVIGFILFGILLDRSIFADLDKCDCCKNFMIKSWILKNRVGKKVKVCAKCYHEKNYKGQILNQY